MRLQQVKPWLTTANVADRLGLRPSLVTSWARTGRLKAVHKLPGIRGEYFFDVEDVEELACELAARIPTTRRASMLLDRDLGDWVREHREQGLSWARISTELAMATSNEVSISYETLRAHYRDSGGAVPPHDRRTA